MTGLRIPILFVVLTVLLGACTSAEPKNDPAFARHAQKMVRIGFTDIHDIYIDPVDMNRLSLAALNGLTRLEPTLKAIERNGSIVLTLAGRTIAESKTPSTNDPMDWSKLANSLLLQARVRSPTLLIAEEDEVLEAFFDGALLTLDRFSRYAGPADAAENRAGREGFGGIGVSIEPHPDGAMIDEVTAGRPAAAAGLIVGDRIVSVAGESVAGYPLRRIVRLLRGPVDEAVALKIRRNGLEEPFPVLVGRTRIVPNTVFFQPKGTHALIQVSSFNQRTAKRMAEAVSQARDDLGKNFDGIVLDLRGNPGGLLDQAVDTADLFLDAGVISKADGRHPESLQRFDAEPGDIADGIPIIILINGASASAAEILAAALQDHGRGVVVGMTSFGKGTIQTVLDLPNGGELYLTWARFLAPSGYALQKLGVMPTVCTAGSVDAVATLNRSFEPGTAGAEALIHRRRRVNLENAPEVKAVQALCPWQPHESGDIDSAIAELLLGSPALYERAIALTLGAGS